MRAFVLGAGFSMPAGMPSAVELTRLVTEEATDHRADQDMGKWLKGLTKRLGWLERAPSNGTQPTDLINIEQLFHYAHFDAEVERLKQHRVPVGRHNGPGTPWVWAEHVEHWLRRLEMSLVKVLWERWAKVDLYPILRWVDSLNPDDRIITFNYDTLVEKALRYRGQQWNHATNDDWDMSRPVMKLHGSMDWAIWERGKTPDKHAEVIYSKTNVNADRRRGARPLNADEDDYELARLNDISKHSEEMRSTGLETVRFGMGGLGIYKPLHRIPGLGIVWSRAMQVLREANAIVVIGFSMSDFDGMARLQIGGAMQARHTRGSDPNRVVVIDPGADASMKKRFRQVFEGVEFIRETHESLDWGRLA